MAKTPEESRPSTDAAPAADAPNASAKRGRGRPPKDGVKKAAYVPTGRPRGRPKSDNPKTYVPTGRPRGRPKGSTKVTTGATAPKPSSGRARGRPRKSEGGAEDKAASEEGGAKRSRGRPRKSDAAAEGGDDVDGDAEGDAEGEDVKDGKDADEPKRKRGRPSRGAEA